MFGPVSVLPSFQKQGYGRKLIEFSIEKAKSFGYEAIFITDNPDYYKKYGFESCFKYGIYYEGMDKSEEAPFFMVKILDESKIEWLSGVYTAPDCYLQR